MTDWPALTSDLTSLLHLATPPLAISFRQAVPEDVPSYDGEEVAAGCVFWMKAGEATFATVPSDHKCSVGSLTHGMIPLSEAARRPDVAALVDSGWVTPDQFPTIPVVAEPPGAVVYGPLAETPFDPDVVFLRLNPKQVMALQSALPELKVEGKPQCHIVPMASEHGEVAASLGCALSRARTGMAATEMTCAIPGKRLSEVVERLRPVVEADARAAQLA